MKTSTFGLLSAAALLFVGTATAQNFNLDNGDQAGAGTGSPYSLPTSAYGAAAAQTGTWFSLGTANGTSAPLADITGAATTVTLTRTAGGPFDANNFALTGDDSKLMCDSCDPGTTSTYTFNNLAAGNYAVYTYAWAPDVNTFRTLVTPGAGAVEPAQIVGGAWTGSPHVLGVTYALHHFNNVAAGGSISFVFTINTGAATLNGFQFVHTGNTPALTPFCFGDGTGTACPCGNTGAVGNGCGSSVNAAGANLAGTGNASIANDTLSLNGTGMPNGSALYFQGTTQIAGGAGAVFGDGLRCAGGSVIRLGPVTNVGGASSYPNGATPISIKGNNVVGNTRTYQCWYRNAAPFCNPETFNLTNAGSATWTP